MKDKITVNFWNYEKKLKKYENKTIDTIILKDDMYNGYVEYKSNVNVDNFIIKPPKTKYSVDYYNISSKNIYFDNKSENTGLNISSETMKKYNLNRIVFKWKTSENILASIDKIYIEYNDKYYNIDLRKEELEEIRIYLDDYGKMITRVESINSEIEYKIFEDKLIETINYLEIIKNDLINGELDLTKYDDFEVISLSGIKINTLKINKEDINKLHNIEIDDSVFIDNIKVIDKNEMKLNPVKIIPFNDYIEVKENYIIGQNENILIYLDKKDNLKIFDKEEIFKDKTIENVEFILNRGKYLVIYKYKDKYKVTIDNKEYVINKLFIYFLKNNFYIVTYQKKAKNALENNDFKTFIKSISIKEFNSLYNSYLEFKDNLKELFKIGFTYEYFMYLHERNLDTVILEMCKNCFDIDKFNNNEINSLNELGRKYVKKLK